MKRYTTVQEWFDKARVGNTIANAYLLNGERVRDCFVWTDEPLMYAIVMEERGYDYPLLTTNLSNITVIIK